MQESAQHYLSRDALEWQYAEGYCAGTTLRCVLKSFPDFPIQHIPPAKGLPSWPEGFCSRLDKVQEEMSQENNFALDSEIFRPESYNDFLETLLSKLADSRTRVAVKFLRPALFGFSARCYWWPVFPYAFVSSLMQGHFSVIVGAISTNGDKTDPLIAIFDVNHLYGGTYLVPARGLYHAVRAPDVTSGKRRALIFVSIGNDKKQQ